ncbi:MAG: winged helix DNA-binding domain-containing protein, partial [Proteobacteria bacterium]|nr:winged helix DNA-binding domain-containing protein [Pseudomonadota bacterium]
MRRTRLNIAEARRIALAAQGFDRLRPNSTPDVRHFRRVVETLGLLQLDYVNVLMPAHFLVLWSRLGAYDLSRFKKHLYRSGQFTEQWAHEASIVPVSTWPLLGYRRQCHEIHKHSPLRRMRSRTAYLDSALKQVQQDGPLTANDLPAVPGPRRKPGDWHRSIPRCALEYHFSRGSLVVADRLPNFQRVYDLPE